MKSDAIHRSGQVAKLAGWALSCTLLLALFGACDGRVVAVAPLGGGGQGGMGGMGGAMTTVDVSTVSTAGGACQTAAPVGQLSSCGGSAVSVSSGPNSCVLCVSDQAGNQWESTCQGDGCACFFGGALVCSCATVGDACTGETCCPSPWNVMLP